MGNGKLISKEVKFNYYQGYLKVDPEIFKGIERKVSALAVIKQKLKEKKAISHNQKEILADEKNILAQQKLYEQYGRGVWCAKGMFEEILANAINTNIDIGDVIIEIEPDTLLIDRDIVSFQLTKMRDAMIPSKKKIGECKEDIKLDNDEYMGEFTSILYDESNSVFMIQSNMYGLTTRQVETYLSLLRRHVIGELKKSEIVELVCELSVIVNTCDINNIRGSQQVKKMRFRAADGVFQSFEKYPENYLGEIRKSFGDKTGFVIDVTISIDRDTEVKSLDNELIEDVLGNYELIKASRHDPNLLVEITRKEDDSSATEVLNLLKPKMSDEITIKIKPRVSVKHKSLLKEMKNAYNKTKKKINIVIGE
ncbi:MAG: hypothetical protein IJA32_09260 [Lachnospiraceae bacterium]|nr:hypothetical protein [Lachnospiraceae bacterium]